MSLVDDIKKHWLGGVIALAALCIGTTWLVLNEVLVKPRDFTIEQQKTNISDLKEKIKELQEGRVSSQNTNSPSDSTVVMGSTWVYENRPILAFDNQVMIKVSYPDSFIHSATFDIDIPGQQPIHWGVVSSGSRPTFTYKGNTYFFNVLDVTSTGAQINIAKKL